MRNILIATCGTSILTNARDIKDEVLGQRNFGQMTKEESEIIKEKIIKKLKTKKPFERECGAEVNSTYYLIEKNNFSKKMMYLIVSDSIDGELAAEIIKKILEEKLKIEKIEIIKIERLNITKEHDFAIQGLRNLCTEVARVIRKNSEDDIMISPIGGLKAQIFMVGLIAQLFKVPAYYLYENSTEIIKLLPLPITLDMDFFKENIGIISEIAKEKLISKKNIQNYLHNTQLRNILEEIKIENESFFALSPLGEVAYEKLVFDSSINLPRPVTEEEKLKKDIQYKNNESHADKVRTNPKFQNFIKKILEIQYVKKILINYYNPDNKGNEIRITASTNQAEGRVLKFEYNNSQGMLGGLILLTEKTEDKIESAIIDIYSKI